MLQRIIKLSNEFISIPSTRDHPEELTHIISLAKDNLSGFMYKEFLHKEKPSLFFSNTNNLTDPFRLILNAHLDVVSAKTEQYSPYQKQGRLYGRGSADMKAAAVTMITLFQDIAREVQYPLGLQITTDEEMGGYNGTAYQLTQGIKCDFVISGESTNLAIGNKAKGILMAKVTAKGRSAHSAYPWEGRNALWDLHMFLQTIATQFPLPESESWRTTLNLAKIETPNTHMNKVPNEASALLEIRYVPEDSNQIEQVLRHSIPTNIELEILGNEPAQIVNETQSDIIALQQAIESTVGASSSFIAKHGASDIRHYSKSGMAGVVFGPIGGGLHGDNEWVDIQSLETYYRILHQFIVNLSD